jgi:hypothetical protein
MPNSNPLKRLLTALSYRLGATLVAGAVDTGNGLQRDGAETLRTADGFLLAHQNDKLLTAVTPV